jgi:hypothetical protein
MSTQVTTLDNLQLPARLRGAAVPAVIEANNDLFSGAGMTFPVLSYKGKVWHIVEGDERNLVAHPDTGDPLSSIEVVLLKANPAKSKVFYASGYVEGSSEKPDCFSNDGIVPDPQAKSKQAATCEGCPNNVWGSRISDNGNKTKACSDSKRVAVAPAGEIDNPMLLRVPPASLKDLQAYGAMLSKRGIPYNEVVTRVGFDHTVAHPQLEFKFVRFLTDEEALAAVDALKSERTGFITGMTAMPPRNDAPKPVAPAAPAPAAPVAAQKVVSMVAPPVPQQPVAAPALPVAAPAPAAAPKRRKGGGFTAAPAAAPAGGNGVAHVAPVAPAPVMTAPVAGLAARLDGLLGELDD